ncbi:hypothetical protein LX92_00144 [Maribacter polysiphoniae]|uniref:Uncharacterized protein n=1 Tax=Maribacter polysiphoniae TaxID=429344 RepID=A0A316E5M3_9FLAO|nr:hypothetical protein LX92_00144 [Maribacter polysiphoniae]
MSVERHLFRANTVGGKHEQTHGSVFWEGLEEEMHYESVVFPNNPLIKSAFQHEKGHPPD